MNHHAKILVDDLELHTKLSSIYLSGLKSINHTKKTLLFALKSIKTHEERCIELMEIILKDEPECIKNTEEFKMILESRKIALMDFEKAFKEELGNLQN